MSDPGKAVFLSYASQDAEAAKRICEALRAAGIEVWFDQSELVGGDAWDQKIRKQIKDCALLIPIISANTQARTEGYFRLEWRLADQRTHLMAKGRPFLLPVVIDGTKDDGAHVPDSFTEVQWTKAPGGEVPAAFVQRVKRLLSGGTEDRSQRTEVRTENREPKTENSEHPRWLVPMFAGLALLAAVAVWQPWRRPASPSPPAAATVSESQKLTAKARAIMESGDDANHETFTLAEDVLKKAVAADVTDGEAWAAYAQLSVEMYRFGFDRTTARVEGMRAQSERAMNLAPDSIDAQLASVAAGDYLGVGSEAGEARLRELVKRAPDNVRLLLHLGRKLGRAGKIDESVAVLGRAGELAPNNPTPPMDAAAYLLAAGRYAEAEAAVEKSLARRPIGRALIWDIALKTCWRGDAATATVGKWPTWLMIEDRGANFGGFTWLFARQPDKALAIYQRTPRDYLHDTFFTGPRAALTAIAHEQAGHVDAARADWQLTLQLAERELATLPGDGHALYWKAWALARTGQAAPAETIRRELEQRGWAPASYFAPQPGMAGLALALGHPDEALDLLRKQLEEQSADNPVRFRNGFVNYRLTRAILQLNPMFDPLRNDERFKKLLADAPAPADQRTESGGQRTDQAPDQKSIAVLPFANLSGDKDQEYFSDGLTEEILTALAGERDLRVPGRASVFSFKGKTLTVPEIARALNVAQVVEGSVRKSGNQVRITMTLTRASDGFSEPLGTFTEKLDDIFALQEKVARAVVEKVTKRTTTATGVAVQTKNQAAYDAYLRARARQVSLGSGSEGIETVRLYEEALRLDPQYALAYARISQVCERTFTAGFDRSAAIRTKATEAAAAARRLAADLPEVHQATAMIRLTFDYDLDAARKELAEAERLRPNDPEAPWLRARIDYAQGPWDDALARLILHAAELDPQNVANLVSMASMLSIFGRFADTERLTMQSLAISPNASAVARRSENYLAWTGDVPRAREILDAYPEAAIGAFLPFWNSRAQVRVLTGDLAGARANHEKVRAELASGKFPVTTGGRGQGIVALRALARLEARQGHGPEANTLLREALVENQGIVEELPYEPYHRLGLALIQAELGLKAEALTSAVEGLRLAKETRNLYVIASTLGRQAEVFTLLGDTDAAVATLRTMHEMGWGAGYRLRLEPAWEPLRNNAKFQQLMKEAEARADAQPRAAGGQRTENGGQK